MLERNMTLQNLEAHASKVSKVAVKAQAMLIHGPFPFSTKEFISFSVSDFQRSI